MKNGPLVSILVAAYNGEKYIGEAIDSALAQDYSPIEIVVVDDGSKDRTARIVKGYTDPRIRYIYQENQGVVGARNRLLREAKGELLTYLDMDDIYLPGKVKEEVGFLETHPEYSAVYCNYFCFFDRETSKNYLHVYPLYEGQIFEPLLDRIFIANTTFMMRRSVPEEIGYYNPKTGIVEDWEYFLRMSYRRLKIGLIKDRLARIRIRDDSGTRFENQPKIQGSVVAIFEDLRARISEEERKRYQIDRRLKEKRVRLAAAYLGAKNKKGFYGAWRSAWAGSRWRIPASLATVVVACAPTSWLAYLVRTAARIKKSSVTIPA
jgi:glycosyltransferase involved in cell wall biosynthesis